MPLVFKLTASITEIYSAHQSRNTQRAMEETDISLRKDITNLSVDDVYQIAQLIGSEVERLIYRHGKESVENLVPMVVRALELLEGFAARRRVTLEEQEFIRAYRSLRRKEGARRDEEKERLRDDKSELEQKLLMWEKKAKDLQTEVSWLKEENQHLLNQLTESQSQGDNVIRKEREVMLKLKEIVDRQRDELRANMHEISCKNKDLEALQEQLDRFMKMNSDLRQKLSISQAQLMSALAKKTDLESSLQEKEKELYKVIASLMEFKGMQRDADPAPVKERQKAPEADLKNKLVIDLNDPDQPCFTKQEVQQLIEERNELKTNLFLLEEEMAYYQREILNEETYSNFFLSAIQEAMKKQKKKIKAKMLGIPQDTSSSEDEDKSFQEETETDSVDSKPPESQIKNVFKRWYRSNSNKMPSTKSFPSTWELIESEEASDIRSTLEPQNEAASADP
ncbi:rab-interacting lysosomal protein [Protopterus annectens]|uniref:rab-interacting lysosomal protein n=1 Tax=Protopterus annectens TaxID=7888 RepID=UPI001CFA2569|nr:rab-interacting lysosomal protein [Protopterus annectens]